MFRGDASGLESESKKSQGLIGGIASKLGGLGAAAAVGTTAAAGAVAALGVASVKAASDFQAGMQEVASLGADLSSVGGLDQLSADVSDLAAEMGLDAVDATKALYDAISAGQQPAQVLEFLRAAGSAAVGGVTDLSSAGSALSVAMNSWGESAGGAENVADVMFATVKQGVTTFGELASSIGGVSGIAAAAGVPLETTAAAIAQITTKGKTTSVAVTQLKSIMAELMKPSKDLQGALAGIGYESGTAAIEAMGFEGVIGSLAQYAAETGQPLNTMFSSVEAGAGALDLAAAGGEEFAAKLSAIGDAEGSVTSAVDEINDSWNRQVELLKSEVVGSLREVGLSVLPMLTDALKALRPSIELAADLFVSLVGGISSGAGTIGSVIADLRGMWESDWGGIRSAAQAVMGWWEANVAPVIDAGARTVQKVTGELAKRWEEAWKGKIEPAVRSFIDWWGANVAPTISAVADTIRGVLSSLASWWQEHGQTVMALLGNVLAQITTIFQTLFTVVRSIIEAGLALIRGDWDTFGSAIQTGVRALIDGVVSLFRLGIEQVMLVLKLLATNAVPLIRTAGALIMGALETALRAGWEAIKATIFAIGGAIVDGLRAGFGGSWDAFVSWVLGLLGGLRDRVLAYFGIASPSRVFAEIGEWLMLGLAAGIDEGDAEVADALSRVFSSIQSVVNAGLEILGSLAAFKAPASVEPLREAFAQILSIGQGLAQQALDSLTRGWDENALGPLKGLAEAVGTAAELASDVAENLSGLDAFQPPAPAAFERIRTSALALLQLGRELGEQASGLPLGVADAAEAIQASAETVQSVADLELSTVRIPGAETLDGVLEGVRDLMRRLGDLASSLVRGPGYDLTTQPEAVKSALSVVQEQMATYGSVADAVAAVGGLGAALRGAQAVTDDALAAVAETMRRLSDLASSFLRGPGYDLTEAPERVKQDLSVVQALMDALSATAQAILDVAGLGEALRTASAVAADRLDIAKGNAQEMLLAAQELTEEFFALAGDGADLLLEQIDAWSGGVGAAVKALVEAGTAELADATLVTREQLLIASYNARDLLAESVRLAETFFAAGELWAGRVLEQVEAWGKGVEASAKALVEAGAAGADLASAVRLGRDDLVIASANATDLLDEATGLAEGFFALHADAAPQLLEQVDQWAKGAGAAASALLDAGLADLSAAVRLGADELAIARGNASDLLDAALSLAGDFFAAQGRGASGLLGQVEEWAKSTGAAVKVLVEAGTAELAGVTAVAAEDVRQAAENARLMLAEVQGLVPDDFAVDADFEAFVGAAESAASLMSSVTEALATVGAGPVRALSDVDVRTVLSNIELVVRAMGESAGRIGADLLEAAGTLAGVAAPAAEAVGAALGPLVGFLESPLMRFGTGFRNERSLERMAERLKTTISTAVQTILEALAEVKVPGDLDSSALDPVIALIDRYADALSKIADLDVRRSKTSAFVQAVKDIYYSLLPVLPAGGIAGGGGIAGSGGAGDSANGGGPGGNGARPAGDTAYHYHQHGDVLIVADEGDFPGLISSLAGWSLGTP